MYARTMRSFVACGSPTPERVVLCAELTHIKLQIKSGVFGFPSAYWASISDHVRAAPLALRATAYVCMHVVYAGMCVPALRGVGVRVRACAGVLVVLYVLRCEPLVPLARGARRKTPARETAFSLI